MLSHSLLFTCSKYTVSRPHNVRSFPDSGFQEEGTIVQRSHLLSSTKGNSRSRHNLYASTNGSCDKSQISMSKKRISTCRASDCASQCNFHFTVVYSTSHKAWFLKYENTRSRHCSFMHTNHLRVFSDHISCPKLQIPVQVTQYITDSIDLYQTTTQISSSITKHFNINVNDTTIRKMRMNLVHALFEECGTNPSGSAADRLISIFQADNKISLIYIKHKYDSGFVTYRKKWGENVSCVPLTPNSLSSEHLRNVQDWRKELRLNDSNDVLVALAWAHDEEIRMATMFPEFFAADMTFGVNKQQRDIFLFAGVDGNMKTFSAFRIFMPSKQRVAYDWAINHAAVHLLGSRTLLHNRCISTDNEEALVSSINSAINTPNSPYKFSKHRQDQYHLFNQDWIKKVLIMHAHGTEGAKVLQNMTGWIKTWFHSVETRYEYESSYGLFQMYYKQKKAVLGTNCVFHINRLLGRLNAHVRSFVHYEYVNVTTLGFKGDSIVESSNQSIKQGPFSVATAMEMDKSASVQAKKVEYLSTRRDKHNASSIGTSLLWINSDIAKHLTKYAAGLGCSLWDRRTEYYFCRNEKSSMKYSWYVISRVNYDRANQPWIGDTCTNDIGTPPSFMRVRTVGICDDGYMNCTCGFPSQYMMPCVHICSVLNDTKFFKPNLFGIRWWKQFNYYHKKDYGIALAPKSVVVMEQAHSDELANGWLPCGDFRGVHVGIDSDFISEVQRSSYKRTNCSKDISCLCEMLREYNLNVGAAARYDKGWYQYQQLSNSVDTDHEEANDIAFSPSNEDERFDVINSSMGMGSQAVLCLSQEQMTHRETTETKNVGSIVSSESSDGAHSTLYSAYLDLQRAAKTSEQVQESILMMQKLMIRFCGENKPDCTVENSETSIYGAVPTNEKVQKRKRSVIDT